MISFLYKKFGFFAVIFSFVFMHTGCIERQITGGDDKNNKVIEEVVVEKEAPAPPKSACLDKAANNYKRDCDGMRVSEDGRYINDIKCCKYDEVIISDFTDITKLSSLTAGLTKVQVLSLLGGMYPYEIYQSNESCEIHSYLYREINREFEPKSVTSESHLTNGLPVYGTGEDQEYNAYIIYRSGKLENVVTEETNIKSLVCFEDVENK